MTQTGNTSEANADLRAEQRRARLGELISECVATFIILGLGDSVAAMYVLYDPSPYQHAYWGVCIAWGLAVTLAIYVTGAVSGTHANPAVTLALCLFRGFPPRKVLPYVGAQVLGAFLGAALVYLLFGPVIDHFNLVHHLTRAGDGGAAGVFFTHPGEGITPAHACVDEIVLTGFLVLGRIRHHRAVQYARATPQHRRADDRASGSHHRGLRGVPRSLADQPRA